MVSDNGVLSCLSTETGEQVWRSRLGGNYAASLLHVDGRIYCFSHQGNATVLEVGDREQLLARNTLDAGFMASPAVSNGALILRTKTHLYRIAEENDVP
jgi:outer membrane protein assembly factor BamB